MYITPVFFIFGGVTKMSFIEIYLVGGLAILIFGFCLWVTSLIIKDASIVDPFWGILFLVAAIFYYIYTDEGYELRKNLIMALVTIWSLRLFIYLLWRNWGEGEDFRYVRWRNNAGDEWWWRSYFKVFLLQGVVAWIVSIPLLAAMYSDSPDSLGIIDGIAVLVWAFGFFFESVGDYQLARFRATRTDDSQILNTGVWRYTRHPNYFGDAAQWWGFYLVAVTAGGFWTIYAPALMTYLLINVSGVAMLERSMRKKPKYDDYIATTPTFFPWFPKQSS